MGEYVTCKKEKKTFGSTTLQKSKHTLKPTNQPTTADVNKVQNRSFELRFVRLLMFTTLNNVTDHEYCEHKK